MLQNAEISPVTSLNSVSIKDAHPTISKVLRTLTGNICGGVCFSEVIGGQIGQVNLFKRNVAEDVLLGIFQNFQNSSFSEHPLKMYEVSFLESFSC